MEKKIISLLLVISLLSTASAGKEVTIDKTVSKTTITKGDVILIKLKIRNHLEEEVKGTIHDAIPQFSQPVGFEAGPPMSMAPSFIQNISLSPKEEIELEYTLSLPEIPLPLNNKRYRFPKTVFIREYDGGEYYSDMEATSVTGLKETECNYNLICDTALRETFENCPQDCSRASQKILETTLFTTSIAGIDLQHLGKLWELSTGLSIWIPKWIL